MHRSTILDFYIRTLIRGECNEKTPALFLTMVSTAIPEYPPEEGAPAPPHVIAVERGAAPRSLGGTEHALSLKNCLLTFYPVVSKQNHNASVVSQGKFD